MNRFNICQAYQQLESDYNVGGWLRERPSNRRRKESIGCQLNRMSFSNPYMWVDINADHSESGDCDAEEVQFIYLSSVLRLGLPIGDEMRETMRRVFVADYLAQFAPFQGIAA